VQLQATLDSQQRGEQLKRIAADSSRQFILVHDSEDGVTEAQEAMDEGDAATYDAVTTSAIGSLCHELA
jgi:hypothetical protein